MSRAESLISPLKEAPPTTLPNRKWQYHPPVAQSRALESVLTSLCLSYLTSDPSTIPLVFPRPDCSPLPPASPNSHLMWIIAIASKRPPCFHSCCPSVHDTAWCSLTPPSWSLFYPSWPPCFFSIMPRMLQPQGFFFF